MLNQIKNYFKFDQRNAILKKEIIGGLSVFLAVCYILAVNPSMVSIVAGQENQGGLFLATAISSFTATMLMGLWARVPITLAPGMGLNAFFTFTVAASVGFGPALSITIMSGILYFILVITPARDFITKQIPHNFKIAVGAGIGLFVAYLGLQNSGIIVAGSSGLASQLGDLTNPLVLTAMCLIFVGLVLHFAKVPGALLITMVIGALIVVILATSGVINKDMQNFGLLGDYGDFNSFGYVVKSGWLGFGNVEMWKNPITYVAVLSFLYTDFFDTTGTLIAVNRIADLEQFDKNWMGKANKVDAVATIFGAGIGATTVTSFVESTVAVSSGAKTGLASVITALCFGIAIAAWPIMPVFMPIAMNGATLQPVTSPVLIVVGVLMLSQIKYFEWEITADIPMLFIVLVFTILTNSISNGLSFGMITYVIMNGSLGVIQMIKHRKKVVNSEMMPTSDDISYDKVKTREFNYLRRLNVTTVTIAIFALVFLILQAGTHVWFN